MSNLSQSTKENWIYGSTIPFAEPAWSRGSPSPYYKESHRRLRNAMRNWVEKNIIPHAQEWEESATLPNSVYEMAARDGVVMPMASGATIKAEWRGKYPIMGDVSPEEWDGFHDFIIHDEFGRVGGIGIENGLLGGATLAVPALQKFGSEFVKQKVVHDVLSGKHRIALAITEPGAGSDVQGVQTEAELSEDGLNFIINGQKKWITSGMYSHYFMTLVKETSGAFTLLVIPRIKGVTTKHIKLSGSGSAGTAFVEFDDVTLPIKDWIVGERGQGFKYIVSNFNHERLFIGMQSLRCARVCLEDSISHALNRVTFGKRLIDHPVIRFKISNMSRETEALQSWLESLIYQLGNLSPQESDFLLAGTTAQLKAHSGIVLEHVVREAIQIMGGIGLTRGGRGERVERIWRDVKAITVPGGSEEILLEFAVKRALKIREGIIGDVGRAKL